MIEVHVFLGRLPHGRSRRAAQGKAEQQQGGEEAETEGIESMYCKEVLHDGAFSSCSRDVTGIPRFATSSG